MALIICPECGKRISDTANVCVECGFPLRSYNEYVRSERLKLAKKRMEREKEKEEERKISKRKCFECGNLIGNEDVCPYCGFNMWEYEQNQYRQVAKEEVSKVVSEPRGDLKCPICGSKNVIKISTMSRAVSVELFGAASGKIGKQYECKKCKHRW